MIYRYWIDLVPMGKQAPRFYRGRATTATKTRQWMGQAAKQLKEQMNHDKLTGALGFECVAYVKGKPTGKPDCDNILKIVWDSMTRAGIWGDDCQVTQAYVSKAKADDSHPVGIEVSVWSVSQD